MEKNEDWVVLTNVSNDIEYEIIIGLLQMGGIPAVKKMTSIDSLSKIFAGVPILAGIDILVPKDKYDEAFQLLNSPVSEEDMD